MRFQILAPALLLAAASCGGATPPAHIAGPASSAPASSSAAVVPFKGEAMELLGGRLRVSVPAGAKAVPRRRSIMAAEEATTEETRVILDPGTSGVPKFVMLAREGFEIGSKDPIKDVQVLVKEDKDERYRIEPFTAGGGLKAAAFYPEGKAHGDGPLLAMGVFLEQPDDTIQTVLFFILPEMIGERPAWEAKAKSIAASLSSGGKKLELPAGERKLDTGEGSDLVLQVPRGFVINRQDGPDFFVYHVRKLTRVGAPPAMLGLYVGGHPSYQYKQNERGEEGLVRTKGTLLGQPVEWVNWDMRSGGLKMAETMGKLSDHSFVHAFATSDSATVIELQAIATSMKVVARPK
ncbi:MAG: hypothetical protein HY898_18300 [Deltaproteobacteria bacterium]|nr:hypothetical protein [Deltaproteobacteria bacterium]